MHEREKDILNELQQSINYQFKDVKLLKQALTTPQLGNELNEPHYEILETLGDAVIKTILLARKIEDSGKETTPESLTKTKQAIENNETLAKIAKQYFNLEHYIFIGINQELNGKDRKILADVLEAMCGAVYLDCNDLNTVDDKIISKFYKDWEKLIKDTTIFQKNDLLEYLQRIYGVTPQIVCEYDRSGPDNNLSWVAKEPRIVNIKIELPANLRSIISKSKKEAEKDLYKKILDYLKEN